MLGSSFVSWRALQLVTLIVNSSAVPKVVAIPFDPMYRSSQMSKQILGVKAGVVKEAPKLTTKNFCCKNNFSKSNSGKRTTGRKMYRKCKCVSGGRLSGEDEAVNTFSVNGWDWYRLNDLFSNLRLVQQVRIILDISFTFYDDYSYNFQWPLSVSNFPSMTSFIKDHVVKFKFNLWVSILKSNCRWMTTIHIIHDHTILNKAMVNLCPSNFNCYMQYRLN